MPRRTPRGHLPPTDSAPHSHTTCCRHLTPRARAADPPHSAPESLSPFKPPRDILKIRRGARPNGSLLWKAENARTLAPLLVRSTPPPAHLPPRRPASVTCAELFLLAPESFCSFLVAKRNTHQRHTCPKASAAKLCWGVTHSFSLCPQRSHDSPATPTCYGPATQESLFLHFLCMLLPAPASPSPVASPEARLRHHSRRRQPAPACRATQTRRSTTA